MLINSIVELSREEWEWLPVEVRKHIHLSLTYTNPKYLQNQRLGFSTFATPKELHTFVHTSDGALRVARGEIRKVFHALTGVPSPTDMKVDDQTLDLPIDIEYKNDSFELDERQMRCVNACLETNQGIIHAATSAGKSAMIMKLIGERKQRTLVIVNRSVLLNQLRADAEKWLGKEHVGYIAAGVCEIGNVTFALEKTLLKFLDEVRDQFGMVIMDECHIAPAASFQRLLNELPARYRYGFTGTVKRKDQMQFYMYAAFGGIIATVTKDELEEADRTTPIEVKIHDTRTSINPEIFDLDPVKRWREMEKAVHEDDARHADTCMLIGDLLKLSQERDAEASVTARKIVVASRYIEPLERIGSMLAQIYPSIRARYVTGQEKDQNESCQMLERGECDVILATIGCFSTGVNIPSLTDLILISPIFSNELLIHQLRGRLMRKSEGKEVGTFHFMWDENVFDHKRLVQFLRIIKH